MTEKNYGLGRVLEPKGMVPAAAWKIDNGRELGERELRVELERIQLEWDSFQQICSSCSYDEERVRLKIADIIEKRGKLHNPFTGSGGILAGTVEAMGRKLQMETETEVYPGERICCVTSLTCIPIYISSIKEIDYNYGQIVCEGYAILFETSSICPFDRILPSAGALAAIDEVGSLFGAYQLAAEHENKNIVVIGRNAFTVLLYAAAVREGMGYRCSITAVIDKDAKELLKRDEIENVMKPLIESVCFVDLTLPVETYEQFQREASHLTDVDQVIVADDIFGAETLAVMMVRPFGDIFFSSVLNHYLQAQIVAESIGKIVSMHASDQYIRDCPEFALKIVRDIRDRLEAVDQAYARAKKKTKVSAGRARSIALGAAGRENGFIYQSPVTRQMVEEVLNVARYDCNVIIQGETGVGKEKVLSLIHQNSERHGCPCIKINCATIAESLAESEFFGYESGAFTGASSGGKPGYFEMADNGILFLDEIGTLSMNMQSKLLRVLQENQFYRVGGTRQVSVNVRVIAANNVSLKELVDQGKFREDLYYRLNICKIEVPPLRERREDILCLAESFVQNWAQKYKISKELSPEALNCLYEYSWPGNVRELENIVHRLVISSRGNVITGSEVEDILSENTFGDMVINIKKQLDGSSKVDFHQLMDRQEKQIIEYALKREKTTRKAAEFLELPQTTFARKKLKHGL